MHNPVDYFSEREGHVAPRESEEIGHVARDGIASLIHARVEDGSFGASFPENCIENPVPIGTDEGRLRDSLRANVPATSHWPWANPTNWHEEDETPSTLQILDTIQFCWKRIGKPVVTFRHNYERHNHLRFDADEGRREFREEIEDILRRNGIAYTLTENGKIERLLPPEVDAAVTTSEFQTGDDELDLLLSTARTKVLDPKPEVRREALQDLWDAWERLITMWPGKDKKAQSKAMLADVAGANSPRFLEALEKEAKELTDLGNKLQIRHFGTDQEKLATSGHVDYLFQRLFSLIWMILRTQKIVGAET